jgi:hypothetical protein
MLIVKLTIQFVTRVVLTLTTLVMYRFFLNLYSITCTDPAKLRGTHYLNLTIGTTVAYTCYM